MAEEDIVVDGLVATIGANKNAALEVLETIRYCKNELGVATICGLSNISFGLPERVFVNTAFLTLAIGQDLRWQLRIHLRRCLSMPHLLRFAFE